MSRIWRRVTRKGEVAGKVVGALTDSIWKKTSWDTLGMLMIDTGYEMSPSLLLTTHAVVVFSLISPPPSASIHQTIDEVEADVREHG